MYALKSKITDNMLWLICVICIAVSIYIFLHGIML